MTNLAKIESLLREIVYQVEQQEGGYNRIPVQQQTTSATIQPNVWNVWSSPVTSLTITKGTDATGVVSEYMMKFTIDSTYDSSTDQITFSGWNIIWNGGDVPTWTAGNTYEISIIDNVAVFIELEPTTEPTV